MGHSRGRYGLDDHAIDRLPVSGKGVEGTMEGKEFRVRSFGKVNA